MTRFKTPEQRTTVTVKGMKGISENEFDLGHTCLIKHEIHKTDDAPFKERHRRIPTSLYAEVKEHLLHLKRCNIIQESASPWASPVVVVRKRSGDLRLCVDYRQINAQ